MNIEIISDERTPIERRLLLRVDSESIEQLWDEELTRASREAKIDGFRQGKAPKHLVERHIGRSGIWDGVREKLIHEVESEIIRSASPGPLAPPKTEIKPKADCDADTWIWEPGQSVELTITYLLLPPTPEEIERDLMRGIGSERRAPKESAPPQGPSSETLPPDPRAEIPGSGVPVDPSRPHSPLQNASVDEWPGKRKDD